MISNQLLRRQIRRTVASANRVTMPKAKVNRIMKIAKNPPSWVSNRAHWMDVVVRGTHDTYAGAFVHFRASCRKHGINEPTVVPVRKVEEFVAVIATADQLPMFAQAA
jgi:hypothetical protein